MSALWLCDWSALLALGRNSVLQKVSRLLRPIAGWVTPKKLFEGLFCSDALGLLKGGAIAPMDRAVRKGVTLIAEISKIGMGKASFCAQPELKISNQRPDPLRLSPRARTELRAQMTCPKKDGWRALALAPG